MTSIFENCILDKLEFNQTSDKLFVYTVNITNYQNNISQFWECLSIKEKIQAKKYYTTYLTNRYIISHGILRYILSHYTKQTPKNIGFTYNEYRKPFLKDYNIQFNTSYSHNIICYVVALKYRVGIDIELYDNILNVETFSDLVFTSNELKFFMTLDTKKKIDFFYDLWTKKEALIKANGYGLSYQINTIESMGLSAGDKIILDSKDNKFKQEWYYFPLELDKNYSGAIATEYKINQIIYLEMNYQRNIFDKIRSKWFN